MNFAPDSLERCAEHPDALVRHTTERSHFVLNGHPSGLGAFLSETYECAECGRQLREADRDR